MATISMLITSAGLAEIVNAEKNGTAPVVLKRIGFGTGQYTPTADQTALESEFKSVETIAGGATGDNQLHVEVHDTSSDRYTVYEVGVFTESGTLFAVASQLTPIAEKSVSAQAVFAIDLFFTNLNPDTIVVGDTNFSLNYASTEMPGVIEIATNEETAEGVDTLRAVTPASLRPLLDDIDNRAAHKTGDETLSGKKLFLSPVYKKSSQLDRTTVPASNLWESSFVVYDKNDKTFFNLQAAQDTAGQNIVRLLVFDHEGTERSILNFGVNANNNPFVTAVTPSDPDDNSTKVATTAWVKKKTDKLLPLTGGTMQGSIDLAYYQLLGVHGLELSPPDASANNGGFVDFHFNKSSEDYTARIIEDSEGVLSIDAPNGLKHNGNAVITAAGGKLKNALMADGEKQLDFYGGSTAENGAGLFLFGKNGDTPGDFVLRACDADGASLVDLRGTASGDLVWNGNKVLTSAQVTHLINDNDLSPVSGEAVIEKLKEYLALSGGSMTATKAIYRDVNDSYLGLHGGTGNDNDGAQLDLCGANHPTMPSAFRLHARNSSIDKILEGRTTGLLLWDEKYVLNNSFTMPTDGGAIMLTGGTSASGGAYFRLYGKDHADGAGDFVLAATNGTDTTALRGGAGGPLYWGGSGIITNSGDGLEKTGDNTLGLKALHSGGVGGQPSSAALDYGQSFTVPLISFNKYGQIDGFTNQTVTLPAKFTFIEGCHLSSFAVALSGCAGHYSSSAWGGVTNASSSRGTLPSGGTWAYVSTDGSSTTINVAAGGTTINGSQLLAVRIA